MVLFSGFACDLKHRSEAFFGGCGSFWDPKSKNSRLEVPDRANCTSKVEWLISTEPGFGG